jgi:AcrR family transcriptional regulator
MGSSGREDGRERNKRTTRRALRAAALELGLERGLAHVTTDEIARRAGVSPRTFFNYFDTKEDAALIELFMVTDEELSTFASGGQATGAWADLGRMFVADVERAERDGPDLPGYMQLHFEHPALQARQLGRFALFLGKLGEAVAARLGGDPQTRTRAEVMAGSCITAVRVGLDRWASQGRPGTAASHVAAAFAEFDGAFGDGV